MRERRSNEESQIAYDCHASFTTRQRNFHRFVTHLINKIITLFLSCNFVLPSYRIYLPTYLPTFLRIYLPSYLPTYLPSFVSAYQHVTDVDTDPRAAYFRQMEYGMYMRMAILSSMLLKRDV